MTSTTAATDRALIEALARRAHAYEGETRRVLDARLAQLLAPRGEKAEQAKAGAAATGATATTPSPLAALLAHIASATTAASGPEASTSTAGAGLKTIQQFSSTWTRLRVNQRLQQSRAQVPGNPGPLNSQRLLHQALTAMCEVSPEYLQRLMAQVEAVLWLERSSLPSTKHPASGGGPEA